MGLTTPVKIEQTDLKAMKVFGRIVDSELYTGGRFTGINKPALYPGELLR